MHFPSLFPLAFIADVVAQHWDPLIILIAKLVTVGALVILNGFFVVAEFALVKIRDSQLKTLADEGVTRAALVKQIRDNLNAYLSACQGGITAARLGLGWVGGGAFPRANDSTFFRHCGNRIAGGNQIDLVCAGIFSHHVLAHRAGGTS